MYDSIVIGSGVAGSIVARRLAEDAGRNVLVLERRNHVGGNCFDQPDEYGIMIHEYGPHIFHTSDEQVYEYLSRFTDWFFFGHEVVAKVDGNLIPVPFNLNTLHMVFEAGKADELEQKLIAEYGEGSRVPIMKLRENQDPDIQAIADYVYEKVFLYYTMKQWGQKPEEIDPAVTGRVPVLISRDNRYFQDKYQGLPSEGFTGMFERMLNHDKITVCTGTDCRERLVFESDCVKLDGEIFQGEVIYTGALDELYDCCYGRLPYRSLNFVFEHYKQDSFQGRSVVNYTQDEDYTRITEFKFLCGQQDLPETTIVKEYPFAYTGKEGEIPYYAINNETNQKLYQQYADRISAVPNVHLLGRLAEYKYYNIDVMAKEALALADRIMQIN